VNICEAAWSVPLQRRGNVVAQRSVNCLSRDHLQHQAMPKAYALPLPGEPIDESLFYLGTLCKRGHDWQDGFTLRRRTPSRDGKVGPCVLCSRIDSSERQAKRKVADPDGYLAKAAAYAREHRKVHGRPSRSKYGKPYEPQPDADTMAMRKAIRMAGKAPSVARLIADTHKDHWANNPDDYATCTNPFKKQQCQFLYLTNHGYRLYHRQKSKCYKAQAKGNHAVMLSGKQLLARWDEFGHRCAYCRCTCPYPNELEIEHVIPISAGGAHDLSNIVPACNACNQSKRSADAFGWYSQQFFFKPERWWRIQQVLGNG
jgi:hypothetical protein